MPWNCFRFKKCLNEIPVFKLRSPSCENGERDHESLFTEVYLNLHDDLRVKWTTWLRDEPLTSTPVTTPGVAEHHPGLGGVFLYSQRFPQHMSSEGWQNSCTWMSKPEAQKFISFFAYSGVHIMGVKEIFILIMMYIIIFALCYNFGKIHSVGREIHSVGREIHSVGREIQCW